MLNGINRLYIIFTNSLNYLIMMKNFLKLEGAHKLTKDELLKINGGCLSPSCCNPAIYCCRPNPGNSSCHLFSSGTIECI